MRTREMGEKFIVSDSDPNKELVYSERGKFLHGVRMKEKISESFFVDRSEGNDGKKHNYDTHSFDPNESIEYAHGVSFLNQVIPEILERFAKQGIKRKVKILDLGGGVGVFASQIREKFGDQVKVYTTSAFGVSKKTKGELAKRKNKITHDENATLHQLDAYKSSIVDFRDYPEFDLVIDTYGEMFYSLPESDSDQKDNFLNKLNMIVRKLQVNGLFYLGKLRMENMSLLWNLNHQSDYKDIKITFSGLTKNEWIAKLTKYGIFNEQDDLENNFPDILKIINHIQDNDDVDLENISSESELLMRTFLHNLSVCVEKQ